MKTLGISGNLTAVIAETGAPHWRLAIGEHRPLRSIIISILPDPISQFHPLRIGVTFIR